MITQTQDIKNGFTKNKDLLMKHFQENHTKRKYIEYVDLLKLVINIAVNPYLKENGMDVLDLERITEINHGDCEGTQIYILPICTDYPSPYQYYWTHNYYGSCSGCDALLHAIESCSGKDKVIELLKISNDLINNFKKFEALGL